MDDDEAFMQLVLGNTQGELSPLEMGMHALKAVPLAQGSRSGGGLNGYAKRIGRTGEYIGQLRSAADVLSALPNSSLEVELADKAKQLYEVSKAPREAWPTLVESLVTGGWTVADASHHVGNVRAFEIPENERHWLPLDAVMRRHLDTREFSAKTVARLLTAANQTREWIATNGDEPMAAAFEQWLRDNTEGESWQPRAIAGYHQRLIAS
jgi:hypothetical protein